MNYYHYYILLVVESHVVYRVSHHLQPTWVYILPQNHLYKRLKLPNEIEKKAPLKAQISPKILILPSPPRK